MLCIVAVALLLRSTHYSKYPADLRDYCPQKQATPRLSQTSPGKEHRQLEVINAAILQLDSR